MRIVKLAEKSDLKFFVFTNPDSSELLGIIVLLLSKKTANLVLNLTEPSARNTGLSSWAMYQIEAMISTVIVPRNPYTSD
jgi:hypothetical protein